MSIPSPDSLPGDELPVSSTGLVPFDSLPDADVGQAARPDTTDPYGIDVMLGPAGDLVVGRDGDLVLSFGPTNCAHALANRMRTTPGELPLHPDYGSGLQNRLIGSKSVDENIVRSAARIEAQRILESDRRFLAATHIEAAYDPENPQLARITLRLQLTGGDELLVGDLLDARIDEIDVAAALVDLDLDASSDLFGDSDPDLDEFDDLDRALADGDTFDATLSLDDE